MAKIIESYQYMMIKDEYPGYYTRVHVENKTGRDSDCIARLCRKGYIECKKVYAPKGTGSSLWLIDKETMQFFDDYITVAEAGAMLGRSRQRIFQLIDLKRIKNKKLIGKLVFLNKREMIDMALRANTPEIILRRMKDYVSQKVEQKKSMVTVKYLKENLIPIFKKLTPKES